MRHGAFTAPRCSSGLEMSGCPPCQRIEQFATGSLALLRPALRQYAEHELDAFDRLLLPTTTFDYEHSRRVRSQHLFEACASPLRPWACTPDEGDWGTWRFKTPDPLQRVAPGFRAAFLLPRAPGATVLLTPLSPTRGPRSACAKRDSVEPAETVPACVP